MKITLLRLLLLFIGSLNRRVLNKIDRVFLEFFMEILEFVL